MLSDSKATGKNSDSSETLSLFKMSSWFVCAINLVGSDLKLNFSNFRRVSTASASSGRSRVYKRRLYSGSVSRDVELQSNVTNVVSVSSKTDHITGSELEPSIHVSPIAENRSENKLSRSQNKTALKRKALYYIVATDGKKVGFLQDYLAMSLLYYFFSHQYTVTSSFLKATS